MGSLSNLTDPRALLIADASTIINVNACGCAQSVWEALPNRVAVVDVVPDELEEGRQCQRQDADLLKNLVVSDHIEIVQLDDVAELYFEQLVIGPAGMTLDDGEAATIAYAVRQNGIALIDERKANRICAQLFPGLPISCTVDIFSHPNVQEALGKEKRADAVFNALFRGRMRVFPRHVDWVVNLIGADRAVVCASLARHVRATRRPA